MECIKCGHKMIEWFNKQIQQGYHCSNCGNDVLIKTNEILQSLMIESKPFLKNDYKKIVIPPHQEEQIRSYLESNPNSLKSVIEQEYKKKATD